MRAGAAQEFRPYHATDKIDKEFTSPILHTAQRSSYITRELRSDRARGPAGLEEGVGRREAVGGEVVRWRWMVRAV